jgi:transcriptional regulator with XRE-family HTH domain
MEIVNTPSFLPPSHGYLGRYTLPSMPDKPEEEEVDRLLLVLKTATHILGLTNREIERRLGMKPSYLGRLFGGIIELRVGHMLAISRALGLAPAELIELAYPRRPDPPSESSKAIHKLLRDMQPIEPESRPVAAISEEGLQKKIQESVWQALRDLVGGPVT